MKNVIGWIPAVFLALLFALVGVLKPIGAPAMVLRFRFWAALPIAAIMFCATPIDLWVLHVPGLARVTAVLMALALVVGWPRRPQKEKP
jgi:hypothetical protein